VDSSAVICLARPLGRLQPRPILANARAFLVTGSDRDLAGAAPSIVREFRAPRRCAAGQAGVPRAGRSGSGNVAFGRSHAPTVVDCPAVSASEIDKYLLAVDEPKRGTLEALRRTILEIVPEAEQVISYRVPAFRVQGNVVAGFAAFKAHLSYLPFSGSVLEQLEDELRGYTMTKSALRFPVDRALPKRLVKKLIAVRLNQIDRGSR
jgi:uncharacterized protein YdhG (YjbR/CyaY superfamily)